jgi:hypothetical protein
VPEICISIAENSKGQRAMKRFMFSIHFQNIHIYYSEQLQYFKIVIVNDVLALFPETTVSFLAQSELSSSLRLLNKKMINDVINNCRIG